MNRIVMRALPVMAIPFALTACDDNKTASPATDAVDMNSVAPTNTMSAGNGSAMAPGSVISSTDANTYISSAGAGDLFEIESSKALLDRSKNAKVRDFAQMMIKAHQESTAKIKAAATADKLTVAPPALTSDQKAMLDDIKAADTETVDAVYLKHQKTAHDAALALHQGYAVSGDVPGLKTAAGEIVAVVKTHLDHLSNLSAD